MKKIINIFLYISILVFANVTPAFATDHTGDAVYKDGTLGGLTWHAAINDQSITGVEVIQAPGLFNVVQYAPWSSFVGSNTYQGPPQYKYGMTANDSQNVINVARLLANKNNIIYTGIDMMHGFSTGTYIYPDNVKALRCDGVVEYCFEWYNFPIMSPGAGMWDISNKNYIWRHSSAVTANLNPVSQWSVMNPHY